MPRAQLHTLISLINRSKDIGDGWRECSDICWGLLEDIERPDLFELDHSRQRVRIKSEPINKSTIDELTDQIYEWREKTILELRRREAHERAKLQAKDLLT